MRKRQGQVKSNFECRATWIERLSDAAEDDLSAWRVLGEAVGVHIARRLLDAGIYVTAAAVPVMRGGGRTDYFEIASSALFKWRNRAEERPQLRRLHSPLSTQTRRQIASTADPQPRNLCRGD